MGAASTVAPQVLRQAGAEVISISDKPNGKNINENCGSTHLENLITKVKDVGADLGVAHDGDADRVLAVDHEGNIIDGDFILGILAQHTELPTKKLVGTVMTNLGLIRALEKKEIGFVATPVGDRYVLEEMLAGGHSLGGEQSGHVIMRRFATTGDGILTALHLISEVAQSKKSLKELASFIHKYPQVLINVKGVDKSGLKTNQVVKAKIAAIESELGESGRVLLRASGTEPVIRVMVEAETNEKAERFASVLAALVNQNSRCKGARYMCGIVGYTGSSPALSRVIEGLRRLEYRGYDSAGVALANQKGEKLVVEKKAGKLANLESALSGSYEDATGGIGHTRWATHGGPTDENAHPHLDESGKLAVIHNGIIENYEELKVELERRGHKFKSETDTESVAQFTRRRTQSYRRSRQRDARGLCSVKRFIHAVGDSFRFTEHNRGSSTKFTSCCWRRQRGEFPGLGCIGFYRPYQARP